MRPGVARPLPLHRGDLREQASSPGGQVRAAGPLGGRGAAGQRGRTAAAALPAPCPLPAAGRLAPGSPPARPQLAPGRLFGSGGAASGRVSENFLARPVSGSRVPGPAVLQQRPPEGCSGPSLTGVGPGQMEASWPLLCAAQCVFRGSCSRPVP